MATEKEILENPLLMLYGKKVNKLIVRTFIFYFIYGTSLLIFYLFYVKSINYPCYNLMQWITLKINSSCSEIIFSINSRTQQARRFNCIHDNKVYK